MALFSWSQTAASNANADSTVNWAEGQAPSSVNDSARAMMASVAKYRDDISGSIVTGGTSTAYTVTSNSTFDTLAHLNNQIIAFSPHTTNAATVTLNVDSLGAKPLRSAPSVELQAGTIVQGTPYLAIYNNSDGVFYLQGFYGSPYNIPLLGGIDYWGTTTPNSSFVFPIGQAVSRTTYSAAFAVLSTTFGSGDGSTTFNLPDVSGRVRAMKEATATRLTTSGGGVDGGTFGATGGLQNPTLLTANLPAYTPAGTIVSTPSTGSSNMASFTGSSSSATGGGANSAPPIANTTNAALTITSTFTGTAQGGTSTPVKTLPPMIVCNYILRIAIVLLTLHASVDIFTGWTL